MRFRLIWILIPIAIGLGLTIGWIDSRPNWDDTGVTAGAVLVVSGLFGFITPRLAWAFALFIGGGIPIFQITLHHSLTGVIAIAVAYLGAYLGVAARSLFKH